MEGQAMGGVVWCNGQAEKNKKSSWKMVSNNIYS